jgi:hypothetical protein
MPDKGYLVFTTSDGDEVHATLITDEDLFNKLKSSKNNDEAMDFWCSTDHDGKSFFAQAPGNYKWPFNNVEIIDTYYLLVY